MRIVAGSARGRRLIAPEGTDTRPTGDRVREAMFNALYSLDDAIAGATVVDLFAGTGALGLEALSRGAAKVIFVERSAKALRALDANITATGVDRRNVQVVRADALDWLHGLPADASFDVALLDPPYDFAAWPALLDALRASLVVIESDREVTSALDENAGWEPIRHRRYGGTVVSMIRRR